MILKIPMPAELLFSMPSSGSTSCECLVLTMKRGGLRTPGRLSSWLILQLSTRILPGRPRASEPSTPAWDRGGSAMNWHTTFPPTRNWIHLYRPDTAGVSLLCFLPHVHHPDLGRNS